MVKATELVKRQKEKENKKFITFKLIEWTIYHSPFIFYMDFVNL
jgi:hypothetical protein